MSVVIAYRSENISILATDTRIWHDREGISFSDDNDKLFNLKLKGFGWVAGAGASNFIEHIKHKLNNSDLKLIDDIIKIYNESYDDYKNSNVYTKNEIDTTGLFASWLKTEEKKATFQIGVISKSTINANGMKVINDNYFSLLYPIDYINNESLIKSFQDKYSNYYKFNGIIAEVLDKIFQMFFEICNNSKGVSNICDVGIYCIIKKDLVKLRLRNDISILIDKLKNKQISNEFVLISKK